MISQFRQVLCAAASALRVVVKRNVRNIRTITRRLVVPLWYQTHLSMFTLWWNRWHIIIVNWTKSLLIIQELSIKLWSTAPQCLLYQAKVSWHWKLRKMPLLSPTRKCGGFMQWWCPSVCLLPLKYVKSFAPWQALGSKQDLLCESRTARRSTRYIVVVRCSSLRTCWSISVEHSGRSSKEPQSDSYNFQAPS